VRADLEQRMIEDLARLRRELPFSVDVTARVVVEVRRMGAPPRTAIASRRVAVASAVAGMAAAAALAALLIPGASIWLAQLGGLAAWATATVVSALGKLPGLLVSGIVWVADFLASFRGLAGMLAPATAGAMAAALAGMVGITLFVVGRDLRRGRQGVEAR